MTLTAKELKAKVAGMLHAVLPRQGVRMEKVRILLDMDEVLVDFAGGACRA